jgi:putative transposase
MYPSDLSDSQWLKLEVLLKPARGERHGGGRPRTYELRRVVGALLYVVKTGCQWRQLPGNFPPWLSVHQQFRAWRDDVTWERVTSTLREHGRKAAGRNPLPTVAIVDSQTAKTALKGQRGYDAGKKTKGRKRHIAVDTQGNLLAVMVHSAGIQDRVGARAVLMRLFCRFDTLFHRTRRRRLHRQADRLGQADVRLQGRGGQAQRSAHLQGAAQAVDRRAHFLMAQLVQAPQQRL